MSLLTSIETIIEGRLAPLLTTASPTPGIYRAVYTHAFTGSTDIPELIERFKQRTPALFLSVPRITFNTPGMPPNTGGGTSQICRVDGMLQYYLAAITEKHGANIDNATIGTFQLHADTLDDIRERLGGYQFQSADYPTGAKPNFVRLDSWQFFEEPTHQISLTTFSVQIIGFGGL